MIRLYLDEDTSNLAFVAALRSADIDVTTTLEAGRLRCTDEEQLLWATEQKRIVYSFNRGDFARLHSQFVAAGRIHAGIILARQQRHSIGAQLQGVLKLMAEKSAADLRNQLVYLSNYIAID